MKKLTGLLVSFAVGILTAAPAFSHHSFAMFDLTRRVTITGVVAEIQWTNPHVWVYVDVPQTGGPRCAGPHHTSAGCPSQHCSLCERRCTFESGDPLVTRIFAMSVRR